ncbi:DUF3147 family protein [Paenibacillus nanensis]|uniref:DUF3147 family protein n=1 Tax=Paenibacillus nanensis TaxID=393251 RepID=A0A3A1URN0_9BACL|nr:DUF3147 family protein [Paenibacillus nanensis]RIX50476.1 DUF3147 family protein [Paenibacillus nanensis]
MLEISLTGLLLRFLFGGSAVAAASLISKRVGGPIGGIFAAFPAVFLAALMNVRLDHTGNELIMKSIDLTQGAMAGMAINVICAAMVGVLSAKKGWKKGLTFSVLGWLIVSVFVSYVMFMV